MSEYRRVGLGEILTATGNAVAKHPGMLVAAFVLLVTVHMALQAGFGDVSLVMGAVADFVFYFFITRNLLDTRENSSERLGSVLVVGAFTALGVALGLVMLIVPGVIVGARWWLAIPLSVAQGKSAVGAMSESWRMTTPSQPAFIALMCVQFGVVVVLTTGTFGLAEVFGWDIEGLLFLLVTDAGITAVQILSCVSSVAAYNLLCPDERGLREVFS